MTNQEEGTYTNQKRPMMRPKTSFSYSVSRVSSGCMSPRRIFRTHQKMSNCAPISHVTGSLWHWYRNLQSATQIPSARQQHRVSYPRPNMRLPQRSAYAGGEGLEVILKARDDGQGCCNATDYWCLILHARIFWKSDPPAGKSPTGYCTYFTHTRDTSRTA